MRVRTGRKVRRRGLFPTVHPVATVRSRTHRWLDELFPAVAASTAATAHGHAGRTRHSRRCGDKPLPYRGAGRTADPLAGRRNHLPERRLQQVVLGRNPAPGVGLLPRGAQNPGRGRRRRPSPVRGTGARPGGGHGLGRGGGHRVPGQPAISADVVVAADGERTSGTCPGGPHSDRQRRGDIAPPVPVRPVLDPALATGYPGRQGGRGGRGNPRRHQQHPGRGAGSVGPAAAVGGARLGRSAGVCGLPRRDGVAGDQPGDRRLGSVSA